MFLKFQLIKIKTNYGKKCIADCKSCLSAKIAPTLVLYRNGKAVDSITAPGSKAEIDRFIQEALAK